MHHKHFLIVPELFKNDWKLGLEMPSIWKPTTDVGSKAVLVFSFLWLRHKSQELQTLAHGKTHHINKALQHFTEMWCNIFRRCFHCGCCGHIAEDGCNRRLCCYI